MLKWRTPYCPVLLLCSTFISDWRAKHTGRWANSALEWIGRRWGQSCLPRGWGHQRIPKSSYFNLIYLCNHVYSFRIATALPHSRASQKVFNQPYTNVIPPEAKKRKLHAKLNNFCFLPSFLSLVSLFLWAKQLHELGLKNAVAPEWGSILRHGDFTGPDSYIH